MSVNFKEYIRQPDLPSADAAVAMLAEVVDKYPWFMSARILASDAGSDRLVALHLLSHPCPRSFLVDVVLPVLEAPGGYSPEDIIEAFLNKSEYKIVPDDTTPDFDAAESSSRLELADDDILSEELAEIYRAQGMQKEADEILRRLKERS